MNPDRDDFLLGIHVGQGVTAGLVAGGDLVGVRVVDHRHIVRDVAGETVLQGDDGGVLTAVDVGLLRVDGVLAVAVIGDVIRDGAEVALDGQLLAVHGVDDLHYRIHIDRVRIDAEHVGEFGAVHRVVPLNVLVGHVGALLERRQGDVLVNQTTVFVGARPADGDAGQCGLAVVLGLRGVLRIVAGEGVLRDQPLAHQLVIERDDVLHLIGRIVALDLAVFDVVALGGGRVAHEVGDDAGGVQQHERAPQTEAQITDVHRDLVGLAVAVRIAVLEGLEHGLQFVPGGRHLKAQLVQPRLVDEHVRGGDAVALASIGRQQVVVAVVIDHLLGGRALLEELLDVRQLIHVLGEIQEVVRVLGDIVQVEQRQADIGEVAGHHLGVLLLAPGVVGDLLPLDVAVAGRLKLLGEWHVLDMHVGHVTTDGDVHDRLAVIGRGRMVVSPTRRQRHHHGRRGNRSYGEFHSTKTAMSHFLLLTTCERCLVPSPTKKPPLQVVP